MHFDAYVSDFDSDDDEIVWPRGDEDDEDDEDEYDVYSVSTVELEPSRRSRRHVYEFGEFEETYGWVQCRSNSQQNRMYFHNMHSGCDTWYRPVARHIDVPSVSLQKVTCRDDLSDLELMSVSDDERERNKAATARDHGGSSTKTQLSTVAQWYRAPKINSSSDTEDYLSESNNSLADERCNQINAKQENNDDDDNVKTNYPPFCMENFLETEILVGEGEVNTEYRPKMESDDDNFSTTSTISAVSRRAAVFTVPRLKRIGFEEQIVKWQAARAPKDEGGPRKIIREMHGVRTISYDLPEPNEVWSRAGVKATRLSESDSDDEDNKLPQENKKSVKMSSYWHSNWHDITNSLHQPILSSASSSSSSGSSSSSDSSGSTSSSTSTCSTCSTCCTSERSKRS